MKKLAAILTFLFAIASWCSPSHAFLHRGGGTVVTPGTAAIFCMLGQFAPCAGGVASFASAGGPCPEGTSFPDGCPGANPASVFQVPTAFSSGGLFNTLAGTSTNYTTTRTTANAAGVDYPVANFTPTASLLDPATSAPAACTHSTTAAGNPLLNCSPASSAGLTISGLDFSARFGHACTVLEYDTKLGPVTITNNNFKNDGNCGFAVNNEAMVQENAGVGVNFPVTITFNSFDGNGVNFPYNTCLILTIDATCNGAAATNTFGVVTIEYNSIVNYAARPLVCNLAGTPNSMTVKYNYIQGWDYRPFNGHTEFVVCNGAGSANSDGEDYEYNTVVQTTDATAFGPVPIFALSTWFGDFGYMKAIGNTVISSLVGNSTATATASGCIGGTSACTTPGSNFYASSVSAGGRIGHGQALGGAQGGAVCVTSAGTLTVTDITAPASGVSTVTVTGTPTVGLGPVSANTITMPSGSGYGTLPMTIGRIITGIGGAGTYSVINPNSGHFTGSAQATAPSISLTAGFIEANLGGGQGTGSSWTLDSTIAPAGSWLVGPGTCTGMSLFGASQQVALFEANGIREAGTVNFTNNYIDSSSTFIFSHSGQSIAWAGTGQGPFTASIVSGTMTITTAQNLIVGEYVIGASVPGCTTDPTTCPTVVSGSGTTWIVTPAISASSQSMTAERPVVCSAPATVSGNVDMFSPPASGSIINPNLSTASFSHGC